MNLNESCVIGAFLIRSCLAVAQALYFLSLKLTSKCLSDRDDLTYFILENFFSTKVSNLLTKLK
jgi:hypothetical protein